MTTKPTEAQVRRLVAKWQKLLNLQHWTIDCVFTGTEENTVAECLFPGSGTRMTIEFNLDYTPEFELPNVIELVVVHEFVHILMRHTVRSVRKLYDYAYGGTGDIGQSFKMELHQHEEDLCDHLAKVLIGLQS